MNLHKLPHHLYHHPKLFQNCKTTPKSFPLFSSKPLSFPAQKPRLSSPTLYPLIKFSHKNVDFTSSEAPIWGNKQEQEEEEKKIQAFEEFEYLAKDGEVFQKTLRLVECAMFSAVSGLVYILSNSLTLENYFGCFFALPIVLSSVRWGIAAGRKTMVATAVLLLVLSGPVKALTYVLSHGLLGFAMGSMWRLRASWSVSIFLCTFVVFAISNSFPLFGAVVCTGQGFFSNMFQLSGLQVRAMGALGSVSLSSLLIGENILALIIINVHAGVTYLLTEMGVQSDPPMLGIYAIFGSVLLVNCVFFVFLLHLLYAVFFTKFGMKVSIKLPRWVETAI